MLIVRRFLFAFIVLFWAVMNVWLWRSEIGGKDPLGTAVPSEVVWQKILTAPDDSGLEIYHRGKKIGHCRWRANVGEELGTGKVGSEELEGRVKHLSGYTIVVEGNLFLEESLGRLRVEVHARFATNHSWQQFNVRAAARPQTWELDVSAAEQSATFITDDGEVKSQRRFAFSDLSDPAKLLREAGYPLLLGLVPRPNSGSAGMPLGLGLSWDARKDWFTVGHSRMRAYRLQAKLLDRYQAVVVISRVGEILRIELPNEIVLVNDAFVTL
jgi:hypothetical protein